jgi:hypothetical protein
LDLSNLYLGHSDYIYVEFYVADPSIQGGAYQSRNSYDVRIIATIGLGDMPLAFGSLAIEMLSSHLLQESCSASPMALLLYVVSQAAPIFLNKSLEGPVTMIYTCWEYQQ